MIALITGINSILGTPLDRLLQSQHIDVVAWNRAQVPPDDRGAVEQFMADTQPQFVFHFAVGATAWAAQVAEVSQREVDGIVQVHRLGVGSEGGNSVTAHVSETPLRARERCDSATDPQRVSCLHEAGARSRSAPQRRCRRPRRSHSSCASCERPST